MKLLILLIIFVFSQARSSEIKCEVRQESYQKIYLQMRTIPTCFVCSNDGRPIIESKEDKIDKCSKTNHEQDCKDLIGFFAENLEMFYFPLGLNEIISEGLLLIRITNCQLKEIKSENLKPFYKLREINLNDNKIEVLEENLFDTNAELLTVRLRNNKITRIHPEVFKALNFLHIISLEGNPCMDAVEPIEGKNSEIVREKVLKVINLCNWKSANIDQQPPNIMLLEKENTIQNQLSVIKNLTNLNYKCIRNNIPSVMEAKTENLANNTYLLKQELSQKAAIINEKDKKNEELDGQLKSCISEKKNISSTLETCCNSKSNATETKQDLSSNESSSNATEIPKKLPKDILQKDSTTNESSDDFLYIIFAIGVIQILLIIFIISCAVVLIRQRDSKNMNEIASNANETSNIYSACYSTSEILFKNTDASKYKIDENQQPSDKIAIDENNAEMEAIYDEILNEDVKHLPEYSIPLKKNQRNVKFNL